MDIGAGTRADGTGEKSLVFGSQLVFGSIKSNAFRKIGHILHELLEGELKLVQF